MIFWTHVLFWLSYACLSYFGIWICLAQLSMFHMERHSRNKIIIINTMSSGDTKMIILQVKDNNLLKSKIQSNQQQQQQQQQWRNWTRLAPTKTDKLSGVKLVSSTRPTCPNSAPHCILIDSELCFLTDSELSLQGDQQRSLVSLITCVTLQCDQGHSDWSTTVRASSGCTHTKVWMKSSHKHLTQHYILICFTMSQYYK